MPLKKPAPKKKSSTRPALKAKPPTTNENELRQQIASLESSDRHLRTEIQQLREANTNLTAQLQGSEAAKVEAEKKIAEHDEEMEGMKTHLLGEVEEVRLRLQTEINELRKTVGVPVRRRMPMTRNGLTHKFSIANHEGYILTGVFEDGSLGEVFIEMQKEGSTIGGMMDTIGILTSMSLQYGVPLDSMIRKFSYQRYEPSGYTNNPDINLAYSITDYVFRWLGCTFIPGFKEKMKRAGEPIQGLDYNTLPG